MEKDLITVLKLKNAFLNTTNNFNPKKTTL